MDCGIHRRPYEYLCKAAGCDLTLLCSECRKQHLKSSKNDRTTHAAEIISLKQAFQQAQRNLNINLNNLRDIIMPFQNEQKIFQKIQAQKRALNQQRDQIIRQVNQVFNKQIAELEARNKQTMAKSKQDIPFQKIKQRIAKLQQAQRYYKIDAIKLKQSLAHSEEKYIDQLRKNTVLSSMNIQTNQYFMYDDVKHDFFLARLELKRKLLNNKLLQKVYNQTDIYFLIDDYKQGQYLHYFSSGQNLLRIYDLTNGIWKQIRFAEGRQMPNYGASVYDPKNGRFYLIGGQNGSRKVDSITWYSKQEGWRQAKLCKARSSPMATIIYDKSGFPYILIAGGVGQQKKHIKHCQLFSVKKNQSFPVSPMNFAVTSGCLVTFNDCIVFRIGGLGQFQPNVASICQIAQKCDFSKYLEKSSMKSEDFAMFQTIESPKWTYLDIQVVNSDITTKYNLFYANQAGIQINPNQIFIFGGMTHNSQGVQQSYILEVESIKNKDNRQSLRYYARWINKKKLISGEGFSGLKPIIFDRKVMSLQNISCGPTQIYEKQKRLIQFDMYKWKEIQNIVNI